MQALVGIIRNEAELKEALKRIEALKERAKKVRVDGGRVYNPGWHVALDLSALLTVAECSAVAALERKESRGGHTRDDHPSMQSDWRKTLLVCRTEGDPRALVPEVGVTKEPQIPVRQDLLDLFELSELEKYFTDEELAQHPERSK
jgi:succinate dehydrogenase / fumarate reductase, flavoprotein subunit